VAEQPRRLVDRSTVDDAVVATLAGDKDDDDDDDEAGYESLAVARRTVEAPDDRWYGRLVAAAHDAAADRPRPDGVLLPAAVSVELLRGYCRLRTALLADASSPGDGPLGVDRSAALLAGDYLHASAFREVGSLPDPSVSGTGYEALSDALESVRAGLDAAFAGPDAPGPAAGPASLVERTAGSLADAAVRLGVSLAGADRSTATDLARAGRDLATARGLRQLRDAVHRAAVEFPFAVDDATVREAADDRRADATRRLRALRGDLDVGSVRHLARAGDRHAATTTATSEPGW